MGYTAHAASSKHEWNVLDGRANSECYAIIEILDST